MRSNLPDGSLIIRTMPNLPLMVGEGCLGYYGDEKLYPALEEIFQEMGMIKRLSNEKLLDAVTGLSGSGPAFVFSFLHAMAEGGVKSGLTYTDSLDLALQTIKGSIEYFSREKQKNPNLHPGELRNRVTSPAGTTIYGLAEWEKNSVSSGIIESIFQAYLRSKQL
jgi:pyrroline-5-carboxylate reductase